MAQLDNDYVVAVPKDDNYCIIIYTADELNYQELKKNYYTLNSKQALRSHKTSCDTQKLFRQETTVNVIKIVLRAFTTRNRKTAFL